MAVPAAAVFGTKRIRSVAESNQAEVFDGAGAKFSHELPSVSEYCR